MLYNYWTGENMWKITRHDPNGIPPSLVERVEILERNQKSIRYEFEELADKVFRWMRRGQAREKVDVATGTPEAQLDPVSAAIMRRRVRRPSAINGGE